MGKLTKQAVAACMSLTMLLPLVAVAAAPSEGGWNQGQQIASTTGSLDKVTGNFKDVGKAAGLQSSRTLPEIIGGILNGFLGLLGVVLVVLIIYAGYKWMTAQGNSQQVDEAKKMITQAVVGLTIVIAAYAITGFVLDAILKSAVGTAPSGGTTPPPTP